MFSSMRRKTALFMALFCLGAFQMTPDAQAQTALISGIVFEDSNGSGTREPEEKVLEGVELTLIAVSGSDERILGQARSDINGAYQFDALNAGEYYLQAVLPGDYYFTESRLGGTSFLPGQGQNSRTPVFSLGQDGKTDIVLGAGKRSGYLEFFAFGDTNMNGGRMSSEPRIRDVQVDILYELDGKSYLVAQGKTNKDGELVIRDLSPATYRAAITMPEPYIIGPLGQKINPFYNVVPPTENNKGLTEPFILERSLGLGIGGVKAGTLKGSIWFDANMDGAQSADETGKPGIKLVLTHLGMGVTRELYTSETPGYTFEYLQAGEYSIKAELPDGLMFTGPGSASIFQDGYSPSQEMTIQVSEEGVTQLQPIGVMPASGITLTAFHDSNVDGLLQDGEPAFTGAQVEVLANGNVVASMATDGLGTALFPRIRQGEVSIRVILPDGQVFTVPGAEGGNAFHDTKASSMLAVNRTVQAGEQLALYAGITLPASISGVLFEDINQSGLQDSGEAGLEGFKVQAVDFFGNIAAEAATDPQGAYLLEGLVPSYYAVRFNLISPFIFSAPSYTGTGTENKVTEQTREYGQTEQLDLKPGMVLEGIDAGAFRSAVVNGAILLGDTASGFDGLQGGLAGVYVELLDESGQKVSEYTNATTDENGAFSLKGALPGTYSLSYRLPEHAKFSHPLTDEPMIQSERLTLKASDDIQLEPLYAVQTAVISGLAYHDTDSNGLFDRDDTPMGNAEILLAGIDSQERFQAVSGEDGQYQITGIRPGHYRLAAKAPEGFVIDFNPAGLVPASISGESQMEIQVSMNERIENTVISLVKPVTVSGHVFYDNDLDGSFSAGTDSPKAQPFTLSYGSTGIAFSLESDAQGQFTAMVFPGEYSANLVLPSDHRLHSPDASTNEEGQWTLPLRLHEGQASLEVPLVQVGSLSGSIWNMDGSSKDVSGISVELFNANGESVASAETDENGSYRFEDLYPGAYILSAALPDTYRFARQVDTGNRASLILSDLVGADQSQGRSEPVQLQMAEHKTGQDIGMGAMGILGDFAWLDLDQDGMQDAGEPGIPGLHIALFQYGQKTAETTTDEYGRYLFKDLFPGSYTMKVEMPGEIKPTVQQKEFPLVASVLQPTEESTATAEGLVVPSGRRNLNADLGFVLRQKGQYPASLLELPAKDWTRVNEQQPRR